MTPYIVIIAVLLVVMFVASFTAARELCDISFAVLVNNVVAAASGAVLLIGLLAFTVIGVSEVFG